MLLLSWWVYGFFGFFAFATMTLERPGGIVLFLVVNVLIGMGRWRHQVWALPLAIPIAPALFFALDGLTSASREVDFSAWSAGWLFALAAGMVLAAASLAAGGAISARYGGPPG